MIPDENLLRALGPECKLVLWLAPGALGEKTPGFASINYLLDGLLRAHLSESQADLQQVVFNHQAFGESFQVVFLDSEAAGSEKFLMQARPVLNTGTALGYVSRNQPRPWLDLLRDGFNCQTLVECPVDSH
jgi:hypothetical protein